MSLRLEIIGLYRYMLRHCKALYPVNPHRSRQLLRECRSSFRKHKSLRDLTKIQELLAKGKSRLQYVRLAEFEVPPPMGGGHAAGGLVTNTEQSYVLGDAESTSSEEDVCAEYIREMKAGAMATDGISSAVFKRGQSELSEGIAESRGVASPMGSGGISISGDMGPAPVRDEDVRRHQALMERFHFQGEHWEGKKKQLPPFTRAWLREQKAQQAAGGDTPAGSQSPESDGHDSWMWDEQISSVDERERHRVQAAQEQRTHAQQESIAQWERSAGRKLTPTELDSLQRQQRSDVEDLAPERKQGHHVIETMKKAR